MGRWPWGRVAVEGRSMLPALAPGDWLVVRWGARSRPGDVIVARRPDRPDLLLVKRAVRREPAGWWLEGDNPAESDDSRLFGPVSDELVLGRVLGRYWPPDRGRPLRRSWSLRRRPGGQPAARRRAR